MAESPKKPVPPTAAKDIKFYYDTVLKSLANSQHTKLGEYIKDVLVESCEAEMEWNNALLYFLNHIRENGYEIEAPSKEMNVLGSKLFELRFFMKMIHAVGLGAYEESLMALEIEKRWKVGVPPSSTTPPSRKGKT